MESEYATPKTLQEVILHFSSDDVCHEFMTNMRWPNGVACPRCGDTAVGFVKTRRIWNCKGCKKQFTVKVGTIFEDSPLKFQTWLPAFWLLANAKNGISSCELARSLDVTQKTAWFMLHRIRTVLETGSVEKLSGEVEADETYVGGKVRNNKRRIGKVKAGRGDSGKTVVFAVLERAEHEFEASRVQATVVPSAKKTVLSKEIRERISEFTTLYTDSWKGYRGLSSEYLHQFVDHTVTYAMGQVHTNGIENFWSLLKRGLNGTYISVEPFHLKRYIDEQVFRFNNRDDDDAGRFLVALENTEGRRLTYDELTTSYEAYYDMVLPR
ncbi:MAG: IS1595 family transposase [Capsulimonadaceae bacterium]|nr:IS1595 family transposase [Capsulimonadaceae bacterium]